MHESSALEKTNKLFLLKEKLKRSEAFSNKKSNFIKIIADSDRSSGLQLSHIQETLWFLEHLNPNSTTYSLPGIVNIKGALDITLFNQSLYAIAERHEILRTKIIDEDGVPLQIIEAKPHDFTQVLDFSHETEADARQHAQAIISKALNTPFDLSAGTLIRSLLIKIQAEEYLWLINMHHIVSDGWSMNIFIQELAEFYAAYQGQRLPNLPALPIQYADFAHWQRQWLSGDVLTQQLQYWREHLTGIKPLNHLGDKARPAVREFTGRRYSFTLDSALAQAIEQATRQHGVSLYMLLLAAFQALLYRHTGELDFCIGSPIANRHHAGTEGLIGFFVNTLVMRASLTEQMTFAELLKQVQSRALAAYEHQDLPFDKLVEGLNIKRDPSRNPIFDVRFVLQGGSSHKNIAGLNFERLESDQGNAKFDLMLTVIQSKDSLKASFEFNTGLFSEPLISNLSHYFTKLLSALVYQPHLPISALPLETPKKLQAQRVNWQLPEVVTITETNLPELFEQQVHRHADRLAIISGKTQITYHELNKRAEMMAQTLLNLQLKPESLIGVCFERSLDAVVALLGIMKAGYAYVPLNPEQTQHRLALLIEESHLSAVITNEHGQQSLPKITLPLVLIEKIPEDVKKRFTKPSIRSDQAAYVLYTSGSTGKPKGVVVEHRHIVNYVQAMLTRFNIRVPSCFGWISTLSADLGNTSLWGALCSGGSLNIIPPELSVDAFQLSNYLSRYPVDYLKIVPSHLKALLSDHQADAILPKQGLILGGEASAWEFIHQIKQLAPAIRIINHYGPTETTVGVLTYEYTNQENFGHSLPMGKPLANMQAHVLDKEMQPVPAGCPGELYISGAGVARGYLGQALLTNERFVEDANIANGQRLYKTGDLVRYLTSGDLEYLGRTDHQVKIRGYRVELGEIETVLKRHGDIQEAAVISHDDAIKGIQLIAYAVPGEFTPTESELKKYLAERLPDYMVPWTIVVLTTMPLSANGKVDRTKLKNLVPEATCSPYVAPRNAVEQQLAAIWSEVLNSKKISVHDNFFELGGHSLLVIRIINKINTVLNRQVQVTKIFEHPTIAKFSEYLAKCTLEVHRKIESIPRKLDQNVPLSFFQETMWFLEHLNPDSTTYNLPAVVQIRGSLNATLFNQSLYAIAERHEILRTKIIDQGGIPLQIIEIKPRDFTQLLDFSHETETDARQHAQNVISKALNTPFDLSAGTLIRSLLIKIQAEEYLWLLNMHHIVSDGWSMTIFIQELAEFYAAYQAQRLPNLPTLPIQYADFAHWQRQWLSGDVLTQQLQYWREHLTGIKPLNHLGDKARPAVREFTGRRYSFVIDTALAQAVEQATRQHGVSLYMLLLAAFQALLYRHTGELDFCIGSPIANRHHAGTEGLIGFFVNTLVMRASLTEQMTFTELLKQVQMRALAAYEHQDLPFDKLVEGLNIKRDPSRNPIFDVMFGIKKKTSTNQHLLGIDFDSTQLESDGSKFDLLWSVIERENSTLLECVINYNTSIFSEALIVNLANYFTKLLAGLVYQPHLPINILPLETSEKLQAQKLNLKTAETVAITETNLHELFEQQVHQHADRLAIISGKIHVTYHELNNRAEVVAQTLLSLQLKPESLIGVCFERSVDAIVTMLGIMKAGHAYVPLNPEYTANRLLSLIEESGMAIVISNQQWCHGLVGVSIPLILLEEIPHKIAVEFQKPSLRSDQAAYVLYTSGSTGKPKGVVVEHRHIVNYAQAIVARLDIQTQSCFGWISTLSADLGNTSLWGALTSGHCLNIIPPELSVNAFQLANYFSHYPVDYLKIVPSHLKALLSDHQADTILPKQGLILGGEVSDWEFIHKIKQLAPAIRIINHYGPTETTVGVLTYEYKDSMCLGNALPIGKPLANIQAYILDEQMQPVPIGCPGELYISGAGVARGYLGQALLTSERFLVDANIANGQRLYKTGDRVRYLTSGDIEYLGRSDHQVKIRGYRVELGEIETVLKNHGDIQEAVVISNEDPIKGLQLIAYAIPGEFTPNEAELKTYLAERLPDYMVPWAIVLLEEMPLSSNGKVDRQKLKSLIPEAERTGYVAPRNAIEQQLAAIWSEVLNTKEISIHDNFFELGGHSLLIIRMLNQIKTKFNSVFPLSIFFQRPTIALLAVYLEQEHLTTATTENLICFNENGNKPPLFCIHPAGGQVLCYQKLSGILDKDRPLYGIEMNAYNEDLSIEKIAQSYVKQITTLFPKGPYLLTGWSFGGVVAFEMAKILEAEDRAVDFLGMLDAYPVRHVKDVTDFHIRDAYFNDAEHLCLYQGKKFNLDFDSIKDIPIENLADYLVKHIESSGARVDAEDFIKYARIRVNNMYVLRKYLFSGKVNAITVFRSQMGLQLRTNDAWAPHSRQPVQSFVVPGDHASILKEPNVAVLGKVLNQCLNAIK